MIRSFRLRLALLAAALAGAALLAFGAGSWWLIRNLKLERLDSELRTHAEREVSGPRDTAGWQAAETRIANSLGIRDNNDFALLVLDLDGEDIFRSPRWPASLQPAQLAWPKAGAEALSGAWQWPLIGSAQAAESDTPAPLLLAQGRGPGGPGGVGPPGMRPPPPGREPPPDADRPPRLDRPPPDFERNRERSEPLPVFPAPRTVFPPLPPASPTETTTPSSPAVAPGSTPGQAPVAAPVAAPPALAPATASPATAAPAFADRRPTPVSTVVVKAIDERRWHIGLATTPRARVAVIADARFVDEEMRGIRNAFLGALPFALLLIGVGGWIFSARALRPLQKLTAATRRVTAQGLAQRIPVQDEDSEFIELIEVYNRMLERLERSFHQAHRFSADAAHELKTPLAILQGQLERAIAGCEAGSPLQVELSGILDEVRRLSTISRKLLLLAQADAGHMAIQREDFDLSHALEELLEDARMLAPKIKITGEIEPGLIVPADGSLLRQILHNLISNAIKYNVPDGWIRISARGWPRLVEVIVANASAGIPPGERSRVFERFYRADPSRGRQIEGVGLGLSVSREIARAHGGDITLKADSDGVVQFVLSLPKTPPG